MQRQHLPMGQQLQTKGEGDFVTAVDIASEEQLQKLLLQAYPEHGFLGEEHAPVRPQAEFLWVVDPIDGTSNYGRGLGIYAVSVACLYQGHPLVAAIYSLPEGALYSAALGLGAWRQEQALRMPAGHLDASSVIGLQWLRGANSLPFLPALLATGTRIRNMGCTVTQCCDLAAGRLDANIQEQGKLWDFAAVALVVTEAGGLFSDWSGGPIFPIQPEHAGDNHPSLAASPAIHQQLQQILQVPGQ